MYKLFYALAICLVVNIAWATDYYVDKNHPSASDTNPGTESLPFLTIQKGIDVAQPGDIVYVKAGTYNPGFNGLRMRRSGTANNRITITNYQNDEVVIEFPSPSSPERGWYWDGFRDYLTINGFEIIGAKYAVLVQGDHNEVTNIKAHNTGSDGICIWGGSYNRIANNEVWSTGWNGIYIESRVDEGYHARANYNIVEYNYSHDNTQHFGINIYPETAGIQDTLVGNIVRFNVSENNKGGMYVRRWLNGEIYGNVFLNNNNNGLFLHHYTNDPPFPFPSNLKIYNNTFVNNTPYWTISNDSFSDVEIKNNIFVQSDNSALIKIEHTAGTTMDNNLYYNTGSNDIVKWGGSTYSLSEFQSSRGQELNGLWGDPLFGELYSLTENSPALDAGTDLGPNYNMSINGVSRPQGAGWDIGAYEMIFGPDVTPPEVMGAALSDSITLVISFSEPLDPSTAQNVNNYSINNGISVLSASLSSSTVTLTTTAHSTNTYTVTVSNVEDLAGNVISPAANSAQYTWTVQQDVTPPEVTGASLLDSITLVINFSEGLEQSSAENVDNYSISPPGINILNAALSGSNVTLSTSDHSPGIYTITVENVKDLAGNTIDPASNSASYLWDEDPLSNLVELPVVEATASTIPEPEHTPDKILDGKGLLEGDPDSRWAGQPIPQWIQLDLGNVFNVCLTRLSFYKWNENRVYDYSIQLSLDELSWQEVVSNASSTNEEWTVQEFEMTQARFVRIVFNSQNQNEWAGLWEGEVWGDNPTNQEENNEETFPSDFVLHQNYPNPFNPSTTISFEIPVSAKATLKIYNSLGQEVALLIDEFLSSGRHDIKFNASDLTSGIYFYTLVAGEFVKTKKMILLK